MRVRLRARDEVCKLLQWLAGPKGREGFRDLIQNTPIDIYAP